MELLRTLIVFALILVSAESLKILGIFAHPGRSHFDVFKPLLEALAERGHELTVIGYFPSEKKLPRYTDVVLKFPGNELKDVFKMEDIKGARSEKYFGANFIQQFGKMSCEVSLPSKQYQDFLKSNLKFDVIITEFFQSNCLLTPLVEKFKIPFIGITSHVLMPWSNSWVGNSDHPGYVPLIFMDYSDQKSFLERVEGTLAFLYNHLYFKYVIEVDEHEMVKKYIGKDALHGDEIMYNTSLILVNSHFTLNRPRPLVPNVVEVGGIHLGKNKKLPTNIEKWINESTHGVIYFSLGSMIKGHTFPEEKRQMFLRAFGRLPQRVLWKWETEMPGKPDNVMIQKWMPQFDILSHPNVKAFIAHGGLLGTTEAVHCGVPMVVMPQFGDQFTNAKAVEASGGGVVLDFRSLDEETIYNALKTVLDPSFNKKAKELSARFRDRPLPPLDTAIYWVEYVARHGGAPHMRTAAVGMPFYKYLLLDVVAFLAAILFATVYISYRVTKAVFRRIFKGSPSKKVKQN